MAVERARRSEIYRARAYCAFGRSASMETGAEMAKRFNVTEIADAIENGAGFCIACGAWRDCCEPDATEYECEECGAHEVYGAAEILIMGLVDND